MRPRLTKTGGLGCANTPSRGPEPAPWPLAGGLSPRTRARAGRFVKSNHGKRKDNRTTPV